MIRRKWKTRDYFEKLNLPIHHVTLVLRINI